MGDYEDYSSRYGGDDDEDRTFHDDGDDDMRGDSFERSTKMGDLGRDDGRDLGRDDGRDLAGNFDAEELDTRQLHRAALSRGTPTRSKSAMLNFNGGGAKPRAAASDARPAPSPGPAPKSPAEDSTTIEAAATIKNSGWKRSLKAAAVLFVMFIAISSEVFVQSFLSGIRGATHGQYASSFGTVIQGLLLTMAYGLYRWMDKKGFL